MNEWIQLGNDHITFIVVTSEIWVRMVTSPTLLWAIFENLGSRVSIVPIDSCVEVVGGYLTLRFDNNWESTCIVGAERERSRSRCRSRIRIRSNQHFSLFPDRYFVASPKWRSASLTSSALSTITCCCCSSWLLPSRRPPFRLEVRITQSQWLFRRWNDPFCWMAILSIQNLRLLFGIGIELIGKQKITFHTVLGTLFAG